jgi:hypothetical protein
MELLKNKTVYAPDGIIPAIGRVCGGGNITVAYGSDAPVGYVDSLVRKLARAGYVITERRFHGGFDGGTPDFLVPIEAIRLIVGVGGEEFGEVVAAAARQKRIKSVYIPTENGFCADVAREKEFAVFYYDGYFMRRPLAAFDGVLLDAELLSRAGEKSRAAALGYGLMRVLGRFDGLFCGLIEGGALNDAEYKEAVYGIANGGAARSAKYGAKNVRADIYGIEKETQTDIYGKNGTQTDIYGKNGIQSNVYSGKEGIQTNSYGIRNGTQFDTYGKKGIQENLYGKNGIQSNVYSGKEGIQENLYAKNGIQTNSCEIKNETRSVFGSAVYSALIYNRINPDISVGEAAFIISYVTVKLYRRFLDGGMPDLSVPKDYSLWTDALSKRLGTDVIKLFKDLEYESVDEYLKRRHIAEEYRVELAALIKLLDERLPALLKKFRRMYSDAGYFIKDKIKGRDITEAIALGASLPRGYTLIKHIDEEGLLDRYLRNNNL